MRGPEALSTAFRRYLAQTSDEPDGLVVQRASGCFITAADGRNYLDFLSGIAVANVGHCHPAVVEAVCQQAAQYLHVMVYGEYIQAPQIALAERLAEIVPAPLSVTYPTPSGAEAVEGALKLARKVTGRRRLIAFDQAYHGTTLGTLSVGGNAALKAPSEPLLPEVTILPFNEPTALGAVDETVAAVLVEPIQGEAGIRVPHDHFLPALRQRCTEVGALLIADEIQTGLGRTGRWFGCQQWGVVPDLLVLAKALGGGMPLGAFIGSPAVMHALAHDPPYTQITTFGGHPLSCAAAVAGLQILSTEGLVERARVMGERLAGGLEALRDRYPIIREIRGRGLMRGLVLASPAHAHRLIQEAHTRGLLIGTTLFDDTVIRLTPPLIITAEHIDHALAILEAGLRTIT